MNADAITENYTDDVYLNNPEDFCSSSTQFSLLLCHQTFKSNHRLQQSPAIRLGTQKFNFSEAHVRQLTKH